MYFMSQLKPWKCLLIIDIIQSNHSHTIREEKEIKEIQIGKEEVKLLLFADDMKLYTENPKDSTKNML